jgi:hypothetical protein
MQHNCGFTYENREQTCGKNDATRIELVASCHSHDLPMKILALLRCCIFCKLLGGMGAHANVSRVGGGMRRPRLRIQINMRVLLEVFDGCGLIQLS